MIRALAIAAALAASTASAAAAADSVYPRDAHRRGYAGQHRLLHQRRAALKRAEEIIVPVVATYSAPGGTLRRPIDLHFIAGEGISRVLESLDLTKVGLSGTLHLTLAYSRGLVRVEGALLTPGAITIK